MRKVEIQGWFTAAAAGPRPRPDVGAAGKKTFLFAPFVYKKDHFAKTGSGQTEGTLKKEHRFLIELLHHPRAASVPAPGNIY
jgi:hypothetical protein